jgi:hypothetical protein
MRVLRVRGGCAAMTLARVCLLMHTGVSSRCSSCSSLPRTTAPVLGHHAAMLDNRSIVLLLFLQKQSSLSHTAVFIVQSVCSSSHRQRSSAVYNGCREAGTTARACGGLRAARIPPTTTNHGCNFAPMPVLQTMVCIRGAICTPFTKPWFVTRGANCIPFTKPWFVTGDAICSPYTNHGLYTGCNFAPTTVLQTMVCIRGPICTPNTNHGLLANCVSCTNHGLYTGCKLHLLYQPGTIL